MTKDLKDAIVLMATIVVFSAIGIAGGITLERERQSCELVEPVPCVSLWCERCSVEHSYPWEQADSSTVTAICAGTVEIEE